MPSLCWIHENATMRSQSESEHALIVTIFGWTQKQCRMTRQRIFPHLVHENAKNFLFLNWRTLSMWHMEVHQMALPGVVALMQEMLLLNVLSMKKIKGCHWSWRWWFIGGSHLFEGRLSREVHQMEMSCFVGQQSGTWWHHRTNHAWILGYAVQQLKIFLSCWLLKNQFSRNVG